MTLFEVKEHFVQPTTEVLLIPPFKQIWERDETAHKEEAIREFTYIEFMCSPKKTNPFYGYPEESRHDKIVERLFSKTDTPGNTIQFDSLIAEGLDAYKDFFYKASPALRLLEKAQMAKAKLENFFETFSFEDTNNAGTPIYKPKDITAALREMGEVTKTLHNLQEKVEQEIYDSTKTRGGREINHYEE